MVDRTKTTREQFSQHASDPGCRMPHAARPDRVRLRALRRARPLAGRRARHPGRRQRRAHADRTPTGRSTGRSSSRTASRRASRCAVRRDAVVPLRLRPRRAARGRVQPLAERRRRSRRRGTTSGRCSWRSPRRTRSATGARSTPEATWETTQGAPRRAPREESRDEAVPTQPPSRAQGPRRRGARAAVPRGDGLLEAARAGVGADGAGRVRGRVPEAVHRALHAERHRPAGLLAVVLDVPGRQRAVAHPRAAQGPQRGSAGPRQRERARR